MRGRVIFIHALALGLVSGGCDSAENSSKRASPHVRSAANLPAPTPSSVHVTLRPQETYLWCWAASGEMIMDFLGENVSQCDEANKYLRIDNVDCCSTPVPDTCVNGGWPPFHEYGFDSEITSDAPLNWEAIKEQIEIKRKPIAFSWHYGGKGGHMMTAIGYDTVDSVNYVAAYDPLPVNMGDYRKITYDAYVSGQGYTHWNDYYDVTKK